MIGFIVVNYDMTFMALYIQLVVAYYNFILRMSLPFSPVKGVYTIVVQGKYRYGKNGIIQNISVLQS